MNTYFKNDLSAIWQHNVRKLRPVMSCIDNILKHQKLSQKLRLKIRLCHYLAILTNLSHESPIISLVECYQRAMGVTVNRAASAGRTRYYSGTFWMHW
jgi:hypothetical protein